MGFFSWTCAKTNLPILAATSWGSFRQGEASRIVAVFSDGSRYKGVYDGYGRLLDAQPLPGTAMTWDRFVNTHPAVGNLCMAIDYAKAGTPTAKLVLARAYADEAYDSLASNRNEPGQGHFHDPAFLEPAYAQGGFATYEAYVEAYDAQG